MDSDTRFVCARDLHEGIEARHDGRFSVVTEITTVDEVPGLLCATFADGYERVYRLDQEIEVVG